MDAVKDILEQLGVNSIAEMEVNENYTIEVNGYDDLTIEKIGEDRVSVGHYHISRGDLMSDPEVVFVVDTGKWKAVRYTQHPLVHKYEESGLGLSNFVTVWTRNLRNQGFVKAAEQRME